MHSTNLLCKLARVHHYQYFTSKYQASERMKLCMILVFVYFPHPSLMKFPPPTFKAFSASAMSALIPSAASSNLSICSWNRYSDVTTLVIGNFVWHRHWLMMFYHIIVMLLEKRDSLLSVKPIGCHLGWRATKGIYLLVVQGNQGFHAGIFCLRAHFPHPARAFQRLVGLLVDRQLEAFQWVWIRPVGKYDCGKYTFGK